MKRLVLLNCLYLLGLMWSASCQEYYEAEGGEGEQEAEESQGTGDLEEADVVNATQAAVTNGTTPSTTPSPERVMNQVNNIISNVEILNITGIVDQALGIRNNQPVRQLVNGILGAIFCNNFLAGFNNCGTKKTQ